MCRAGREPSAFAQVEEEHGLFWHIWWFPDNPRGALRWSLSKIRQIVNAEGENRIEAEQDTVFIRTEDIDLDLRRVTQLNSSTIETADIPALEAAASAFRGGFLKTSISRVVRNSKLGVCPMRMSLKSCASVFCGPW